LLGLASAADRIADCVLTSNLSFPYDFATPVYHERKTLSKSSVENQTRYDKNPDPLTRPGGYVILQSGKPCREGIIALSTKGVILKSSYKLRRHLWAESPLSRWLGMLLLAAALSSLLVSWLRPWAAVLIGILYVAYILILAWSSRREYIHYESQPFVEAIGHSAAAEPPLRPEELIPVRASGWFSVEGRDRYYMDLDADFETVATREHILLGRVRPSHYLQIGRWSVDELGWWYVFFQPAMISELDVGYLYFGAEPQQVLRLIYTLDAKTSQTIYLAFGHDAALRRVWNDLLLDVPPDVVLPA